MTLRSEEISTIEAQISASVAVAEIVRIHLTKPLHHRLHSTGYRIDMSFLPRKGEPRVRYRNHWGAHRYEPVGDIFLLHGEERVDGISAPAQGRNVVCTIQPVAMRAWFEDKLEWTDHDLVAALNITDGNIRSLMLRLAMELRQPGFASQMLIDLIAAQLAIEMRRFCSAVQPETPGAGLAAWQFRKIDALLDDGRTAVTLRELAASCRLSVRQLTRGFRTGRGCSIGEYVTRQRIDAAKRMLLDPKANIKSIAVQAGFSAPSSFTAAFRRATGVTPALYRRSLL